MLKLIASDLDGTLLPPDKNLPEETFPLIRYLAARGVTFCPASGRQLPNLKKLFEPVLPLVAIIAENGGVVYFGGRVIFKDATPTADVMRTLDAVRATDGLYPVLSCCDKAYIEDTYPKFNEIFLKSFTSFERVADLKKVAAREEVIKISVWDDGVAAEHGGKILPPLLNGLRTIVSGRDWLDVSVDYSGKGRALNALMERLGVVKDECAAFGDHMNDAEMLEASGHAYYTANAFPLLKARVGEEVPSNADLGVIKKIKELFGIEDKLL